jgi:hypothetical protein
LSSDPAAGAPAAVAAGAPGARLVAARNGRIPFEILAAITVVGVAAAGRFAEAALVAFIVGLGAWLGRRLREAAADAARRARIESHTDPAPARERAPLAERALSGFADWFMPLAIAVAAAVLLRNADVVLALTLLLVASPQALLALPRSSPAALRALAASAAAALLVATLAGLLGPVAAALLLQASTLAARFGQRLAPVGRGRPPA